MPSQRSYIVSTFWHGRIGQFLGALQRGTDGSSTGGGTGSIGFFCFFCPLLLLLRVVAAVPRFWDIFLVCVAEGEVGMSLSF